MMLISINAFAPEQYVHYGFSTDMTPELLTEIITIAEQSGIVVIYVNCDQGSSNRGCLTKMGVTSVNPRIRSPTLNIWLFVGFDAPHLFKNWR